MIAVQEKLRSLLHTGAIPHALLFKGRHLYETAYQFAADLICHQEERHRHKTRLKCHPDIHLYYPEGKTGMHPLQMLKTLAQDAALTPFEAKWKIFILYDAERCLPTSANALLKTLEEPAPHTLFLLTSTHPEKLLPTVTSRCQVIECPPESVALSLQLWTPILLDMLGNVPSLGALEKLAAQIEEKNQDAFQYQQAAYSVLETILYWYRDRLLLEIEGGEAFLTFPDRLNQLKQVKLLPLERVEKLIAQMRLALERSMKLSTCLEALFLLLKK